MSLDSLSQAFLVAVDHLTRETYGESDGAAVINALRELGYTPEEHVLDNLARRLKRDGYIEAYFAGGGFASTAFIGSPLRLGVTRGAGCPA